MPIEDDIIQPAVFDPDVAIVPGMVMRDVFINHFAPPPRKIEHFPFEFEGVVLNIPDWVCYITQDTYGNIDGWSGKPKSLGACWVVGKWNDKFERLAKPEKYAMVCEEL